MERISQAGTKALYVAQHQARRIDHNYIGQEHLLLGLVGDETNTATRVLAEAGLSAEQVRSAFEATIGRGQHPWPESEPPPPFAPRLTRALDLAVDEARRLNHYDVGTGHMLIGLIRERTGAATMILSKTDVAPDELQEAAVRLLKNDSSREPWLRRYQLTLPAHLFESVQWVATQEDTTLLEVLRRFVRLGLLVEELRERPDVALIIREADGSERELVLI